jgi:hypothetical protein
MKIRKGFVSNSSSSSYIIKILDEPKSCPRCGRGGIDLMKLLRNCGSYNFLDSKIDYDNKEQILKEIRYEIQRIEKNIKKYAALESNEIPEEQARNGSTCTASDILEWDYENLEHHRDRYDIISAVEGELVGVSIGYYDDIVLLSFNDGVKNGAIEIIDGDL